MEHYNNTYYNEPPFEEYLAKISNITNNIYKQMTILSDNQSKIFEQTNPFLERLSEQISYFNNHIPQEIDFIQRKLEYIDIDKISKTCTSFAYLYNNSLNPLLETLSKIDISNYEDISESSMKQIDDGIKIAYQSAQKLKEDTLCNISIESVQEINEQENNIEKIFSKLSSMSFEEKIKLIYRIISFIFLIISFYNNVSSAALTKKDIESRQELINEVHELNQKLSVSGYPDFQPKPVDFQAVPSELQEAHSDSQGTYD